MSHKVIGFVFTLVLLALGVPRANYASKASAEANSPQACADIGGSCAAQYKPCSSGLTPHETLYCDKTYTTICCLPSGGGKNGVVDFRALWESILVGTEFTFSRQDLRQMQMGHSSAAQAQKPMQQWAQCVQRRHKGHTLPRLVVSQVRGKVPNAYKFTYDLGKGLDWWWIMDADDSCLETQTKPTAPALLQSHPGIQTIVSEDIFGCAASLELVPDPSAAGGGGHISLDSATAFDGDALLLIETLSLIEASSEKWGATLGFEDPLNSPWVKEQNLKVGQPALPTYRKLLATLGAQAMGAKPLDFHSLIKQLQSFTMRLRNPQIEKMKKSPRPQVRKAAAQAASAPLHYQAVNVEHMLKTDGSARLELRALGAQRDLATLARDLRFIFEILAQARQNAHLRAGPK